MAEPVTDRATLRRAICKAARMPFYLKYTDQYVPLTGTPTTDALNSSDMLKQRTNEWKGSYIYIASGTQIGQERPCISFTPADGQLIPEYPSATAPAAADQIELLNIWPAHQVHDAINTAIRDTYRNFPNIVTDETIIVQENKLSYTISGLATVPAVVLQVKLEVVGTAQTGQMSSTSGLSDNGFLDTAIETSDYASTEYIISFYNSTGVAGGEYQNIASADTATGIITMTSDWGTVPDTESKYCIWKPSEEEYPWTKITDAKFDQPEHPDKLYLASLWPEYYGMRLRLTYTAQEAVLAADTSETTVPRLYITYKALSYLHDILVGDNKFDENLHARQAEYYDRLARDYADRNPRRRPQGTLWQEHDPAGPSGSPRDNPMGW